MPRQPDQCVGSKAGHWVISAGRQDVDLLPAELALARFEDRPAADVGDHLRAEADAEEGTAGLNPIVDDFVLALEIGVSIDLIDVLIAAENDEPRILIERPLWLAAHSRNPVLDCQRLLGRSLG